MATQIIVLRDIQTIARQTDGSYTMTLECGHSITSIPVGSFGSITLTGQPCSQCETIAAAAPGLPA